MAALKGSATPRIFTPPLQELTEETSLGFEMIEFCERILGLELRPWQKWLAIHALELDTSTIPDHPDFDPDTPENRWYDYRFREVLVLVGRQNGKTLFMTVLGLWRLFSDGAAEILSTAQNLANAEETLSDGFLLAKKNDVLRGYLPFRMERGELRPYMYKTNGAKRIELDSVPPGLEHVLDVSGAMPSWAVVATNGAGRSFSADLAMLDELREHKDEETWDAISPTSKERPRNQIWAFSNAGDESSIPLRRLRNISLRAIEKNDFEGLKLGMFEWSADPECSIFDREGWAQANPSLGYGSRTESDMLSLAKSAVDPSNPDSTESGFRTEFLCQWVETIDEGKINEALWASAADPMSKAKEGSTIHVGVDVGLTGADGRPGRVYIYGAAERDDGLIHVEHLMTFDAYSMAVTWLESQIGQSWFDGSVGIQATGSTSTHLSKLLESSEVEVVPWNGSDMSASCLGFWSALHAGTVKHLGADADELLAKAAVGVRDQARADTWIWSRSGSHGDAAPFIAANVAWWMATRKDDTVTSAYSSEAFAEYDDAELRDDDLFFV